MRGHLYLVVFLFCWYTLSSCNEESTAVDPIAQLTNDLAAIDAYIAQNGVHAMKDVRGIRFEILSLGTGGFPPRIEQTVEVSYTARLLSNGEVFEDRTHEGRLSGFIAGLQLGLSILPPGTRALLFIPSGLAYGVDGLGNLVPPNANVVFEVELVSVARSAAEEAQLVNDINAIDLYLQDNAVEATADTTGLRYVVVEEGTGDFPTWYSKVNISYSARLMNSGEAFFSGTSAPDTDFDSRVVDFIPGMQAGLQKISEGGKVVLYVPSGLAFGTEGAGNGVVPSNANVIYEIELLEIVE